MKKLLIAFGILFLIVPFLWLSFSGSASRSVVVSDLNQAPDADLMTTFDFQMGYDHKEFYNRGRAVALRYEVEASGLQISKGYSSDPIVNIGHVEAAGPSVIWYFPTDAQFLRSRLQLGLDVVEGRRWQGDLVLVTPDDSNEDGRLDRDDQTDLYFKHPEKSIRPLKSNITDVEIIGSSGTQYTLLLKRDDVPFLASFDAAIGELKEPVRVKRVGE
jgi:hypothetical protein